MVLDNINININNDKSRICYKNLLFNEKTFRYLID